jgi:tripartite-type tricarboxylate transporter receptor subunit TctC
MKRRFVHRLLAGLAIGTCVTATPARAAWPDKPISIVVPYAPGGTADALARLISQHLATRLNTTVVVLNKPGASGVIGQSSVVQAAGDGYTVLYDATPLSINPHLQKLPFDPQRDLVPVTLVGVTPMLAVVPKKSPYDSLQDLIKAAKGTPGKVTFGSGGQGTVQYMAAELFAQGAGINLLHVPYKSGGPAITGLIGGEIDLAFLNLPAISGHVSSGLVKPLAITSAKRNPAFADVPAIGEAAVKNYEVHEWNGMFVPSATPPDIVARLSTAVRDVLAMPEVKAKFDGLGSRIVASSPEEFRKYLATEAARWEATVKAAGIRKE